MLRLPGFSVALLCVPVAPGSRTLPCRSLNPAFILEVEDPRLECLYAFFLSTLIEGGLFLSPHDVILLEGSLVAPLLLEV